MLEAHLRVERGRLSLDAPLHAAPGEVLALLGPNGAGKTTALHALAGLVPLHDGRIVVDGQVYDEPATGRYLAPEHRAVGMVPQDYLLFPHLSVLDNVAFAPRARGASRRAARTRAAVELERLGLGASAGERPRALSGGQAQRVALARALAGDPRLLLLDEPLGALDARTRMQVRSGLREQLRGSGSGAPTVLVTHDPLDAMVLADRLVVLEDGAVVQEGSPGAAARRPRTDYVARLVGLNLLRGTGAGREVTVDGSRIVVPAPVTGPVLVAFPPTAVVLSPARPEGSARNVWAGRVVSLSPHGDLVRVETGVGAGEGVALLADVTPAAVAELQLATGRAVFASIKASELSVYPA